MCKKLLILIFLFAAFNLSYADLQSAVDSLKLEIEKNPDDYLLHFKLGSCYYSSGEYEEALQEFNRTLELNSDYSLARYKIAAIYYAMDSFDIAKTKFEKLLKIYPEKKAVYVRLGFICGLLGNYDKMLQIFQKYTQETDYDFSYECGIACVFLGNYENAINYYQRASEQYTGLELELAIIYHHSNDTTKANSWFKKSLKYFSGISWPLDQYGFDLNTLQSYKSVYYYLFGKFDEAIEIINDLIKHDKHNYIYYYNLGVFRIASGDADGLEDIKNACDLDTTGFVQAVYDALIAVTSDSFLNAEILLKQKIGGLKRSGIAKGLLALTLEKLGKDTEAKIYWFKCYGKLPLGIDVESMRNFIDKFIRTIKS
jgi:tetratricopeptide (TPR) repeat protein